MAEDIQECKKTTMKEKMPKEFEQLSNEQKKVIVKKSRAHEFDHRYLLGPYLEILSQKEIVAYIGLYKDGKKHGWGKMVIDYELF